MANARGWQGEGWCCLEVITNRRCIFPSVFLSPSTFNSKKNHLRTKSKRTLVHGRGVHGEGRGLYAHVNQIDLLFFLFYFLVFKLK